MKRHNSTPSAFDQILGLDPAIAFGLAGAILFFLVGSAVAYFNLQTIREGNRRIIQSHAVITALDELLSRAQDAETGQRGFLLTNRDAYLQPYTAAIRAIPAKLDEIS